MRPQLTLDYNKTTGLMKRLVLSGVTYKKGMDMVGATLLKDRTYSFPVDEVYARVILGTFQQESIQAAPDVTAWLEACYKRNMELIHFKEQEDYDGLRLRRKHLLRPFQRVDIGYMKMAGVSLNANPMGSGKTIETIGLAEEIRANKILIICNKVKMDDWAEEIQIWADEKAVIVRGTAARKNRLLQTNARYFIITHATLRTPEKYPTIFSTRWDLVAADEGHRFKNMRAAQTFGFSKLMWVYLSIVTGTPMLNKPDELYALLHVMFPERFKSYTQFVANFCEVDEYQYNKVIGIKNAKTLQYILAPYTIKREKKDILPQLPDKIYKTIHLDLTAEQAKLYKEMDEESQVTLSTGEVLCASTQLAQLVRLRQLALEPSILGGAVIGSKIMAILELIEEAVESGVKVVIATTSKAFVELVVSTINNTVKGAYAVPLHGGQTAKQQNDSKKMFKEVDTVNVMAMTIETGSEGLNLQHASMLILADKSYVPKTMEQLEDRLHRDGQMKNPLIISIVCRKTVDEVIEKILNMKDAIINEGMAINTLIKQVLRVQNSV